MIRNNKRVWCQGICLALGLMLLLPELVSAQQARGVYFSVFGPDAPLSFGDPDFYQAIYFDIPLTETRPVYVRVFDAEVGGYLDERVGTFNTTTRFVILGGNSAGQKFGDLPQKGPTDIISRSFPANDIINDRSFGTDTRYDGRYVTLGSLPVEKGYKTADGYARFVMLVMGLEGDDGNYFDYVLSFNPNDKDEPGNTRMFTYAITLRAPDFANFRGQIRIPVLGQEFINIHTFGLHQSNASISVPFYDDFPFPSSPPDAWLQERFDIPSASYTNEIAFNFFGTGTINTFSLLVKDATGNAIPIPLPILDYEPGTDPRVTYEIGYPEPDCHVVQLSNKIMNDLNFQDVSVSWILNGDTLKGETVTRRFEERGYHPFELKVSGFYRGVKRTVVYSDSIFINTPPFAWAGGNRNFVAGRSMAFDGTVSEDYDGRITRYLWDFGDGNTAQGARIDHMFERPGTYTVYLTVIDNSETPCNSAKASVQVRINQPPVARIVAPQSAQVGSVITLDGTTSNDPDGEIINYLWTINNVEFEGPLVEYTVQNDRPIQVQLEVTDDANTINSKVTARTNIRVNRIPIARAGADKHVSPGRPATYNASQSSDPDGRVVKYEWLFPNDVVVTGPIVQQGIDEPGWHKVYLSVTDNEGAVGVDSMNIRVNFPPVPVITGDRISNSGRVTLSAEDSYDPDPDGQIISYEWYTGDGRRIIGPEFYHAYKRPGRYNATLTIIDNSGTFSSVQTERFNLSVNQLPVAVLQAPVSGAPGQSISFNGNRSNDPDGSISEFRWDFGDGNTTEGNRVNHIYANPGTYQVQLMVRDNSGHPNAIDFDYTEIVIKAPPVLIAENPARVAPGKRFEVNLSKSFDPNPGSAIRSYYWYQSGRWERGEASRTFDLGTDEQKSILFAIDNGLNLPNSRVEGETLVRLNRSPVASALRPLTTSDLTVSFNASTSTDPDGDPLTYEWNFGDGNTAAGPVVIHTYQSGGRYEVKLIIDDQQGLANSSITSRTFVNINRPPIAAFNVPEIVCAGEPFTMVSEGSMDSDGDILSYRWFIDNTYIQSGNDVTHSLSEAGTFVVRMDTDDGRNLPNSVSSVSTTIRAAGKPVPVIIAEKSVCEKDAVLFDASESFLPDGEIIRYHWNFGDGNTAEGVQLVHRYSTPGKYIAKLTVEGKPAANCSNTASTQIEVQVFPEIISTFSIADMLFEGDELILDPTQSLLEGKNISTINWSLNGRPLLGWKRDDSSRWIPTGSGLSNTHPSLPVASFIPPSGSHVMQLTVSSADVYRCNTSTSSKNFTVTAQPDISIRPVPVLAPNQTASFSLNGTPADLALIRNPLWDFGDGNQSAGKEVIHRFQQPGNYEVTARAINGSMDSNAFTLTKNVLVNYPPTPKITGPSLTKTGLETNFNGLSSSDNDGQIMDWRWYVSDGATFIGPEFTHVFKNTGTFMVSLVVTDDSGVSNNSASETIRIRVMDVDRIESGIPEIVCRGSQLNLVNALNLDKAGFDRITIMDGSEKLNFPTASAYVFDENGTRTFRVIIDEKSVLEQVIVIRSNPLIQASVPATVALTGTDSSVLFDASATSRNNDGNLLYRWDFGDGNQRIGAAVRHQYRRPGTYKVTLTVTDNTLQDCNVSSAQYSVQVLRD